MLRRVACHCGAANAHRADCIYARLFEPVRMEATGPSGFRDHPRPFVFRARDLDGRTVEPGNSFCFAIHVFEMRLPLADLLKTVFSELASDGLGPTRGRSELIGMERQMHSIDLENPAVAAGRLRIEFLTPTELKGGEEPVFSLLFARIRDRVGTLRALYGGGPLDIDFRGMAARAAEISMPLCEIGELQALRHSTRTGQRHPLYGFVGAAEYTGALTEFLPFLQAAVWTGVGRQTVWGKGELSVQPLRPDER